MTDDEALTKGIILVVALIGAALFIGWQMSNSE